MNKQAILNFLGLAARARKIISGEELVVKEVRSSSAMLVIIAEDASANTMKKITDKCKYYNVEYHVFGDRYDLGHATGKEARVALAITDKGFAKKLSSLLNEK
ncbi:50S ribosomal protein L7 [Lysinibacillus sp. BF-4]|uniref:Putative ribosomal protein YlxQ n=1 Tax=Metalysinibacillus saudimassiliensis TaxID=1461583 RepID=A0A078MGL3_9BACL|nr:YlxQ family RNA-binding protein [Lysinibacillus sp. BF-4]KFL44377.1 50S ribosomal protein L7 [Lysinibacillus sp. BF-4]CEA04542.1 putative ribosomal protein YlxQ [Metalysinibacillus saudimassiliensis]